MRVDRNAVVLGDRRGVVGKMVDLRKTQILEEIVTHGFGIAFGKVEPLQVAIAVNADRDRPVFPIGCYR